MYEKDIQIRADHLYNLNVWNAVRKQTVFAIDHFRSRSLIPGKQYNGNNSTFLGSMLNFFLPMAICLFLCVVLLHMEKGERKKKKAILNYSSTTEQFLDKFILICILTTSNFLSRQNWDIHFV